MPSLATDLRRQLENVVVQARDLAEAAARASLRRWGVDAAEPFDHFSAADKAFRNRLRARGRQAGDQRNEGKKTQEIDRLTEELAYEYWHRMLFARFLAENQLLMHPDGVAVTLAECEELAQSERAPNGFVLAARFASRMLPEIFRSDDVLMEVEFPINDRLPLEKLLASLPVPVFTADDSLGWVYQFWQTKKKDEVNKSGQKIDGRSLPAVTQLFTEHYMVEFLLHNTIGAWWCAKEGITGPPGGAGAPEGSPVRLDYLRWSPSPVAQPPPAGSEATESEAGSEASLPLAKPSKPESRRNLPHFQAEGKSYYVTFCTHTRWTLPEEVRAAIVRHCLHDHGRKLSMHALTVMPDHVHLLFTPHSDPTGRVYGLSEILGGIKGASAHTVNKRLSRKGHVWQDESFDHFLRSDESLEEKMEYIRRNPVRAGLISDPAEYPFTWIEGMSSDPVPVAQPPSAVIPNPSVPVAQPPSAVIPNPSQPGAAVPPVKVQPAAGAFEGWPRTLREFTMLDPCCGSGHFLVAGFHLLVPLRRHDEGLSATDAVDSVLRENLHGLELDPRCTQIAAFALAMAAWKYPGEGGEPLGYRPLPPLNIACSGQGVVGSKEDWVRFANGDNRFREGMERLYDLFQKAPTLGSLIDPRTVAEDLFALGFATLKGTLDRALKKIEAQTDPDRAAVGVTARGIALAASLMAREFTLVATNVPYLARGKQVESLRDYIAEVYSTAKADLATVFVDRCLDYCSTGGSSALVTPQNWLFLGSYKLFREHLLKQTSWNVVAKLGPGAFETISGEMVNVVLSIHTKSIAQKNHRMLGLNCTESRDPTTKSCSLLNSERYEVFQSNQLANPDTRIVFEVGSHHPRLEDYAICRLGLGTGDAPHYLRHAWELPVVSGFWSYFQSTTENVTHVGGYDSVVAWDSNRQRVFGMTDAERKQAHNQDYRGREVWGKRGVAVSIMSELKTCLYSGELFDKLVAAIVPLNSDHLPAIYSYVVSEMFNQEVRKLDQKLMVTNSTLVKVPFDLNYWQQVAAEEYPNGLPEPHSNDPTQWLFKGHPRGSTDPLQVAVARLLGYRWPDQEPDDLDSLTDKDGIVPIPAARGESPAADRLREVLSIAFGSEWSGATETRLLADSGAKPGTTLDDWLRTGFFEQHCKRFHNRPFVWHLWDGRKDGFACLVNYHKLDHTRLETLTYSYLQDWITAQAADAKSNRTGADLRLNAAQELQDKLKLILAGEPPYDIFVRWKPLAEQPVGWNPDLNDGVRLNIRPFMTAGLLRKNPTSIKWTKDRGNEPKRDKDQFPWFWDGDTFSGERVNDKHYTNAEKQAARDRAK